MKKNRAGSIYIVKNRHYAENYYKVGKTSRSAHDRLSDQENISAFSLEDGSVVVAEYAVYDIDKVEKLIHKALLEFKVDSNKKEWFQIEINELKKIIKTIVNENNYRESKEISQKNISSEINEETKQEINGETKRKKNPIKSAFKFLGIIIWIFGLISLIGGFSYAAIIVLLFGLFIHFLCR